MSWDSQYTRSGNYRLNVWKVLAWKIHKAHVVWQYELWWESQNGITSVGRGSETYDDALDARQAAVLHLANILPKAQSERLLTSQSELVWEPYRDPHQRVP